MRAECVKAVQEAVGRKLTARELTGIEERITAGLRELAQKDRGAYQAMSKADQLTAAGELAAKQLLSEAALKAERAALQVNAMAKLTQHLDSFGSGIKSLEGLSRLLAFHSDDRGGALSIESTSNAIRNEALSRMLNTLEASNPKFFGMLENEQGIRDIIAELHGADTGNADAKAGAKSFKEVAESLRQRFNRAGGDVGQLDDWGMPHHHSQHRVLAAGRDQWIADVMPLLNRERYANLDGTLMNDAQVAEFLGQAWTTISSDGANKMEPGRFQGNGARANRGKASRQVHFKDGDAYIEYQTKYGERGLYEILVGHISGAARDIALVEGFGPNPDLTFRTLNDTYTQKAKLNPTEITTWYGRTKIASLGDIDRLADWNNKLYTEIAGKQTPAASLRLAAAFDAMRSWMVSTRLGSAIISSVADEATMSVTARLNGLPLVELWRNEVQALNPANSMEKRLANRAGLGLNTLIADLNRFANDSLREGVSSKLAGLTMRLSGLNAMTDARRRAFGSTMMSAIGRLVRDKDSLAKLDPDDNRLLLSKGLTETDWKIWREAQLEDWGNGSDAVLTPESVYAIPDEAIDRAIGDQLQQIRDAHQNRITELQTRNAEEDARIGNRLAAFEQYQADATAALGRLAQAKTGKADAQRAALKNRIELLSAKIEQAKLLGEVEAEAAAAKSVDKMRGILADLATADGNIHDSMAGRAALIESGKGDRAVAAAQARGETIGRNVGERLGIIKRRIVELEAQARQAERDAGKAITGKAKEVAAKIEAQSREVDEYIQRAQKRQAARERVIAAIEKDIEPRIAAARQGAREQAATRLLAHVLEETNMAVIEPGSRERALMHIGAQRGTWKGELVRSVWLFKSFGLSMITRHFARAWNLPTWGGTAAYLTTLAASTTVLGALAVQLNELLNGRDPRNMKSFKFAYASLMKGGGLGMLGDFAFSDTTQYGNSLLATAAGPMAGMFEDVDNLTRGNLIQAARGDETNAGAELVRFAKGNIPVIGSLWYTKAALNHLFIHQLQEWASPGYLSRMEQRAQREFGQEYWWAPGDVAPDRGPDMGSAWQ
jgi:uncharacterized damage-inducible protein DinB